MFLVGLKIRARNFWACEISRKFPDARFKVLDIHPFKDGGRGILDISGKIDEEALSKFLRRINAVKKSDVLFSGTGKNIVSVYFSGGLFSKILSKPSVYIKPPLTLESGYVLINIMGTEEHISDFLKELRSRRGLDISILRKSELSYFDKPKLTEKQLRVIRAAIEEGYYNVPRKTTIAKLAKKLGMSQANVAEHLQKAERRIILETMSD